MIDGIVTSTMYDTAKVITESKNGFIEVTCWNNNVTGLARLTITIDEAKALWLALNEHIKAIEGVIES